MGVYILCIFVNLYTYIYICILMYNCSLRYGKKLNAIISAAFTLPKHILQIFTSAELQFLLFDVCTIYHHYIVIYSDLLSLYIIV